MPRSARTPIWPSGVAPPWAGHRGHDERLGAEILERRNRLLHDPVDGRDPAAARGNGNPFAGNGFGGEFGDLPVDGTLDVFHAVAWKTLLDLDHPRKDVLVANLVLNLDVVELHCFFPACNRPPGAAGPLPTYRFRVII